MKPIHFAMLAAVGAGLGYYFYQQKKKKEEAQMKALTQAMQSSTGKVSASGQTYDLLRTV